MSFDTRSFFLKSRAERGIPMSFDTRSHRDSSPALRDRNCGKSYARNYGRAVTKISTGTTASAMVP